MNKTFLKTNMMMALAAATASCGGDKQTDTPVIGKQQVTVDNGLMTPEALWAFGRIGTVSVSPDGQRVAYTVSYYSIAENNGNSEIFVMNADGSGKRQLTRSAFQEAAPRWMNDSQRIAYLSNESGSMQAWMMNADGSGKRQLTDREGGIADFAFSPDETRMLFIANVPYGQRVADLHPDLPKATGRVIDDLMYRHWDEWTETVPHPFVADFSLQNGLSNERDLLAGEPYESPVKPFGGIEQVAWSRDGKSIAYTSKKMTGTAYALSTNTDIYLYTLETGDTRNLTEPNKGYDMNPAFSPDGRWMAWESMERDGYESDKNRLMLLDLATGTRRDLSARFPESVHGPAWSPDGQSLYFTACVQARTHIYQVDVATGDVRQITTGDYDYLSAAPAAGGRLIAARQSMSAPTEIYSVDPQSGEATELSFENQDLMAQLQMGRVEERWIPTTDGKQMLTWVVYPPHFDPAKKYPALLYCQGGPQSPVSQFWSYRWNIQIMAANGYIVVMPNRRGVPGFGQEWLEQISGDYGGQNMRDYLAAIDAVAAEPYVDRDHLGCVGASYGGYSVYWLAGHHDKRFKAFIAHNGMFNFHQKYLTTEETFFANWDLGGPYWDKDNATAQRSFANSPHWFVDRWDTPILVIVGERDYRIPYTQGLAAFSAARLRDIPAQLLVYPDECHWVQQPQNAVLWQRTFFAWLDRWLKEGERE